MAETPPTGPGWSVRESSGSHHRSSALSETPYGAPLPAATPVGPPPVPPPHAPSAGPATAPPPVRATPVAFAPAPPPVHTPAPPPVHVPPLGAAVAPPPVGPPAGPAPAPPTQPWGERIVQAAPPPHAPVPPAGRDRKTAGIGIALAVLVAGAASAILLTGNHTPPPVAAARSATSAGPATAKPTPSTSTTAFADPAGYFTVSFTASPVKDVSTLPIGNQNVPYVQWSNRVDLNVVEVIAYANYPASTQVSAPNAVLSASLAGSVAASKGTLISNVFGNFEGFHSADGLIAAPHGAGYAAVRVILAGHTMFEIIASGLKNPPTLFTDLVSSFRIVKHAS